LQLPIINFAIEDMGELEGSDLNKTESSLEVVPEEHSPVLEKESDTHNTISQEPNDHQVTSIVDDDQSMSLTLPSLFNFFRFFFLKNT
jgi:hypothetical protein